MKVVCEGCQAKYQVPDERVAGRKLRIKCRRCGNAIIVRGDHLAVSQSPAQSAGDEWHVSFEDVEHGPMDHAQLMAWLGMRGDRWDAYVWCEGMDDWLAARDVTRLSGAVRGAVPNSEDDSPTQMVHSGYAVDQLPRRQMRASQTADPFPDPAYPPVASDRPPAAAPSMPPPSAPPAYPSSPGVASRASRPSSPRVSADDVMTGSRNEESLLFSASSLRSVAASSSANLALGSDPLKALKGLATGDGSGLIDIAALASLSAASAAESRPPASPSSPAELGHTPMVGSVQNLRAPEKSSGMLPVAIFAGALVMAAAVFMAIVLTQKPAAPAPVAAVQPAAVPAVAAAAAIAAPAPPVPEAPAAPAEAEATAATPAPDEGDAPAVAAGSAESAPKAVAAARVAPAGPVAARKPKAAASKPAALAKVAARKEKPGAGGIDDLLAPAKEEPDKEAPKKEAPQQEEPKGGLSVDDILAGPAPKSPPKEASIDDLLSGATAPGATSLPASPSRDAVIAAMKGVSSAVRRCGTQNGVTGVAKVAITVEGESGRVSSADVSGVEGPAADCISTAVAKARFPKFSKPTFSLNYPFKLQ